MKVLYRLPKYIALILAGVILFLIYDSIKKAKCMSFFDIMKSENIVNNSEMTFLGINAYWVLMLIGLFCTIVLAYMRKDMYGFKTLTAILIAILFFLQAFGGAKLLYGIESVIDNQNLSAFNLKSQSLYGTLFMSFVTIPIIAFLLKINVRKLYDYIAPFWLVLLIFVRTGCFVKGCCGANACLISGVEIVLPVQLFEVLLDLIILQVVFNIEKKNNGLCEKNGKEGISFFVMIALYGLVRFILEFIRNTSVVWIGMTYGQIYSIICAFIAICCIKLISKKSK